MLAKQSILGELAKVFVPLISCKHGEIEAGINESLFSSQMWGYKNFGVLIL
jgi:hypothetical protein